MLFDRGQPAKATMNATVARLLRNHAAVCQVMAVEMEEGGIPCDATYRDWNRQLDTIRHRMAEAVEQR